MMRRLAANLKMFFGNFYKSVTISIFKLLHLGSRQTGPAYVIGDSMLRLLPIQKTQKHQCQIDLHPQPGKTVIGVRKYIEQNIEEVFYMIYYLAFQR